jgi:hypothetical protein
MRYAPTPTSRMGQYLYVISGSLDRQREPMSTGDAVQVTIGLTQGTASDAHRRVK